MTFTAPLPEYFVKVYNTLASKDGQAHLDQVIEQV
jgi:hypothetical protein